MGGAAASGSSNVQLIMTGAAPLTFEGLFSSVGPQMCLKVSRRYKGFRAVPTTERFFSSVGPEMYFKVSRLCEGLWGVTATEGLFSSVDQ